MHFEACVRNDAPDGNAHRLRRWVGGGNCFVSFIMGTQIQFTKINLGCVAKFDFSVVGGSIYLWWLPPFFCRRKHR